MAKTATQNMQQNNERTEANKTAIKCDRSNLNRTNYRLG